MDATLEGVNANAISKSHAPKHADFPKACLRKPIREHATYDAMMLKIPNLMKDAMKNVSFTTYYLRLQIKRSS
jgi:hypothetical protein